MSSFTESAVEQATLAWLESMGYLILSGLEIAPGETMAERESYGQVVLDLRLRQALQRLNPQVPADALEEAFRKLTRPDSPSLVASNHVIHKYLVEGVPVSIGEATCLRRAPVVISSTRYAAMTRVSTSDRQRILSGAGMRTWLGRPRIIPVSIAPFVLSTTKNMNHVRKQLSGRNGSRQGSGALVEA